MFIFGCYVPSTREREEIKETPEQKMAKLHSKGGNQLKQESIRQKTMEGIDGGLHPAVDGQRQGRTRLK